MTIINQLENYLTITAEMENIYNKVTFISEENGSYKFAAYSHELEENYILTLTPFERDEQIAGYSLYQYNTRTNHSNFVYDIELEELEEY